MDQAPVIALEFNELSPVLMDRFIQEGRLPNFARLRDQSIVTVTDAEEEPPALEPWIQWVTVHTGLSYSEHGVFDLGDGHKLKYPRLWDMASDAGKTVWVCGSMNAAVQGDRLNGCVLPDPWSTGIKPSPAAELTPFFHFVRSHVQEYTRDEAPLTTADHIRFAAFMASHGLSAATVMRTLTQLASERGAENRWRRVAILDRLQWDVFRHYWLARRPAYATFFLNSTAHLQHYYWRNLEPETFRIKPSDADQAKFAHAVMFGYQSMDAIVGEVMAMAPDAAIVLLTALSQQPLTRYEASGGKQIHRPHDPKTLLEFAGVRSAFEHAPVMAEEFRLHFKTSDAAAEAERRLLALSLDGKAVMRARRDGAEIFAGCDIFMPPAPDARVSSTLSNRTAAFTDLFYLIDGMKSGCHHPDGMFWVRTPGRSGAVVPGRLSLRQVAPTLAALIGLPTQGLFALPPLDLARRHAPALGTAAE
jgi:hypothetical protein